MKRILAMDVGDKTIGLAISDPLGITAQGLKTIKRTNLQEDLEEIREVLNNYDVDHVVLGLPINMNGTIGPQGDKVKEFAKNLERKLGLKVKFEDERLTTVSAERILIEADMSRKKRKEVIDTVAATYILQTYLDRR